MKIAKKIGNFRFYTSAWEVYCKDQSFWWFIQVHFKFQHSSFITDLKYCDHCFRLVNYVIHYRGRLRQQMVLLSIVTQEIQNLHLSHQNWTIVLEHLLLTVSIDNRCVNCGCAKPISKSASSKNTSIVCSLFRFFIIIVLFDGTRNYLFIDSFFLLLLLLFFLVLNLFQTHGIVNLCGL